MPCISKTIRGTCELIHFIAAYRIRFRNLVALDFASGIVRLQRDFDERDFENELLLINAIIR